MGRNFYQGKDVVSINADPLEQTVTPIEKEILLKLYEFNCMNPNDYTRFSNLISGENDWRSVVRSLKEKKLIHFPNDNESFSTTGRISDKGINNVKNYILTNNYG